MWLLMTKVQKNNLMTDTVQENEDEENWMNI